jgi:hypothetical protein
MLLLLLLLLFTVIPRAVRFCNIGLRVKPAMTADACCDCLSGLVVIAGLTRNPIITKLYRA